MAQIDDDLAFILADQQQLTGQGVVRWSGKTFNATFDDADDVVTDESGRPVIQDGQAIRCRTMDLPLTAKSGQTLTIDGESYKSRRLLKLDEGRVTLVLVGKV